jgi:Ca2+-binding RTX toxin-like protein
LKVLVVLTLNLQVPILIIISSLLLVSTAFWAKALAQADIFSPQISVLDTQVPSPIVETLNGTVQASAVSGDPIICPPFNCVGTNGNDIIIGTSVGDTIDGLEGNDNIQGQTLSDVIHGNEGDDIISGGEGTDTLFGDEGNDVITGDSGTNIIFGGGGNAIYGGPGDDKLLGGSDNDLLVGGQGHDYFDCNEGDDTVADFDPKEDTLNNNCEIVLHQ